LRRINPPETFDKKEQRFLREILDSVVYRDFLRLEDKPFAYKLKRKQSESRAKISKSSIQQQDSKSRNFLNLVRSAPFINFLIEEISQ